MVQGVADDFGNDGLRRDARELLFEPGFERQHEWFAQPNLQAGRLNGGMICNRRGTRRELITSTNSHLPNIALPSTCGQRTAYHITEIVDADDVVERVVHRLIAREIGFAEDRRLAIERFIHVDELDHLALGIENGAYGARADHPSLRWSRRGHSRPRS